MTDAYERWRDMPFPEASSNDATDDLHKDLAYWDAMAAEILIPVVERGAHYDEGALDLDSGLRSLSQRITAASTSASTEDRARLRSYDNYAEAVAAAIQEVRLTPE